MLNKKKLGILGLTFSLMLAGCGTTGESGQTAGMTEPDITVAVSTEGPEVEEISGITAEELADYMHNLAKLSKREGIGEAILLREALDMLLKKYDN